MKAITDFAATRLQIVDAVETFTERFEDRQSAAEIRRTIWVAEQKRKDWFRRSFNHWNERSLGRGGDTFENYAMRYKWKEETTNFYYFEAHCEQAIALLKKFDCAVNRCEAYQVILSDADLLLLVRASEERKNLLASQWAKSFTKE